MSPTPSLARNLFDRAVAGGAAFLRQLVADKTPESEWLDFKYGDHLDEAETKVTWSRALCGFANNEGRMVIPWQSTIAVVGWCSYRMKFSGVMTGKPLRSVFIRRLFSTRSFGSESQPMRISHAITTKH